MQKSNIVLIAKQFLKKAFSNKGLLVLLFIYIVVVLYVTITSRDMYAKHSRVVNHHQEMSRKSWEANPDKHPHRMAHFGAFAFREQHPLSVFDSGIESYTGNSIFLEAHKQNTANFSEASLSTGLVRFGDFNIAMLLQLILPLIIFFIGYSCISAEKENGILKIVFTQGATIREILFGKSVGIFIFSALFFIPALLALWSLASIETDIINSAVILRIIFITISYLVFYLILSFTTVFISAKSKNSNSALLSLLGGWLLFFIIIPKTAQVVGNSMYPNLSKIEFKASIEEIVSKKGDSHNPDDPHFATFRDSILKANNVTDVKDLPFNYTGYLMSKGEKQSADVYNNHHRTLIETYKKQNSITNALVFINPYLAVKNISMSLSATNFDTYINFLNQAEDYRYKQSQYMNDLQMKFISNKAKGSEGKVHVVEQQYWKDAPRFQYQFIPISVTINNQLLAIITLCFWLFISLIIVIKFSNRFRII